MRGRAPLALLALAATGCLRAPPTPAVIQLEVLRGFAQAPQPTAEPAPVELLLDLTASMQAATRAGPPREAAARRGARRFVAALGKDVPLGLHSLGGGSSQACEAALASAPASTRADDLDWISGASGGGEASLATAIEQLGERALRGGVPSRARVVAFTDLGDQCGGDLCAAADRLATAGVRLDLIVIGDALVPACLSEYREVKATGPPAGAASAPQPRFHIEEPTLGVPAAVAWGRAGGAPVRVEPGPLTVVIEFDPPLRVERTIAPGDRWLLQVLEFPAIDPWARRWRWSRLPEPSPAVGGAAR
jgi:hypothetical protein